MENNTLNGFDVFLDQINNVGGNSNDDPITGLASEAITDEEIEALKAQGKKKKEDDDDDIDPADKVIPVLDSKDDNGDDASDDIKTKPTKKTTKKVDDDDTDSKGDDTDSDDGGDTDSASEEMITGFFDVIAQQFGWDDVEDEEKPKTPEELVEYFRDVIEENSTPNYASEDVKKLDEFVRNGGRLQDYFEIDGDLDLENIELEDDENNQKLVLKEFLKEKGYNSNQIQKKISKYEDAGILEDEATDALEGLRELKNQKKEQLLSQQQKAAEEAKKQQQDFFNNVVSEIKGMDSIYGINVPEKDKRALLEYIFKPGADGKTKYQKDYAKSLKNLITSAYFTMKGDTLIDIATKKGKRDALDSFKQSLTRNSGVTKKSRKQTINGDTSSIWDSFTRSFRA